jgi:hypothetical protein
LTRLVLDDSWRSILDRHRERSSNHIRLCGVGVPVEQIDAGSSGVGGPELKLVVRITGGICDRVSIPAEASSNTAGWDAGVASEADLCEGAVGWDDVEIESLVEGYAGGVGGDGPWGTRRGRMGGENDVCLGSIGAGEGSFPVFLLDVFPFLFL